MVFVEIHEPHAVVFFKDALSIEKSLLITSVLAIRNNSPYLWTYHTQRHLSFETRLIEAWEDSIAMESFELGVEILLAVRLVNELMKPGPIFLIWSKVLQTHDIPPLAQIHHFKSDLLPREVKLIELRVLVDCKLTDSQCVRVQE